MQQCGVSIVQCTPPRTYAMSLPAEAVARAATADARRVAPLALVPMRFGAFPVTETGAFPPSKEPDCWVYVTLNAEIALSLSGNRGLSSLLDSHRLRLSVDGQWLWWGLRRKYPKRPLRKLSGSDLIYDIARHCAARGERLLVLGGRPDVNAQAAAALAAHAPGLQVTGAEMPFYDGHEDVLPLAHAIALGIIKTCQPDYVVLGLGACKEHQLAAALAPLLDNRVTGLLCFGGAIDIAGGAYRRAPLAWQRAGLEGLYRVWQDPGRALRLLRVLRILPRLARGDY